MNSQRVIFPQLFELLNSINYSIIPLKWIQMNFD